MKEFLKKNTALISWIAIGILVVSIGLLFVPGSFFKYNNECFGGYEYIFFYSTDLMNIKIQSYASARGQASGAGIAALVFMLLGGVTLCFNKKSSALVLIGGIFVTLSGALFLSMQGWTVMDYKTPAGDTNLILYMDYIIGGLQFVVGIVAIVASIFKIQDEKQELSKSNYSYIKHSK